MTPSAHQHPVSALTPALHIGIPLAAFVKPGAAGDGCQGPYVLTEAPESPVLHADDLRPDPGALADGEHYVTTPAGNRIRSKFEVVDSSALTPAEGDLQNRDRSRDSTDLQVQSIVAGFDPARLGPSAESDRGAPIVGTDGTVESGNGRMLALNRIQGDPQHVAKADAYRAYVESQGHSTEGIASPVLIRRRVSPLTPDQRRQFVIDSNKDAKLSMTSVERARSDADALDGNTLALYRGGDVSAAGNGDFVKAFNSKLAPGEIAGQIDDKGQPSQEGTTRIENALMARAYENPHVLSKLIEARDNNIRSIGAGMLDNAGAWAKLRADAKEGRVKPEFDVTSQLVEAARRVSDIRAKGSKIGDELAQGGMFEKPDPIITAFMRLFYTPDLERPASREAITNIIAAYARRASEQTTDARLFGGDETSPEAILFSLLTGAAVPAPRAASATSPDIDIWHAEVKARRHAKQEKKNEANGSPQWPESSNGSSSATPEEARAQAGESSRFGGSGGSGSGSAAPGGCCPTCKRPTGEGTAGKSTHRRRASGVLGAQGPGLPKGVAKKKGSAAAVSYSH